MSNKKKEHLYLFDYNFWTIQIFCLVLTALFIVLTVLLYGLFDFKFLGAGEDFLNLTITTDYKFFVFIIVMILWLVLHEVIHGVSYVINGANVKNVKYGVVLEKGILYCKCGEYVNKNNILWSVINPFIYIGVVTYFISFVIESPLLLFLSLINISGACADILMFMFFIRRDKDMKFKEIKDSSTFILKTTEDLSNKKFFAVKLVKELDKDEFREEDKLITVSKISKWILIIMLVLVILSLLLSFI